VKRLCGGAVGFPISCPQGPLARISTFCAASWPSSCGAAADVLEAARAVPSLQLVAHRVVWSCLTFVPLLWWWGGWRQVAGALDPLPSLALETVLLLLPAIGYLAAE